MAGRLVPLGGLGEFGANTLLVEDERGEGIVVDAGAAFSDMEVFGVAFEVPDLATLPGPPPRAIVVTHGHDDHIKGLPLAHDAFPEATVVATRGTLARARRVLDGGTPRFVPLVPAETVVAGGFRVEGLPVSHSMPGTAALRLRGEAGTLVLATDLRLEPSGLGEVTPVDELARWGGEGVDVLLLDATNALVESPHATESDVAEAIAGLVAATRGAVFGVTFASHMGRFRQLALAAAAAGRVVVPVGRGVLEALDVQAELGGLGLPAGLVRAPRDLARLDRDRVVVVLTGAQGEPGSAFARLAGDELPGIAVRPSDLVLHAARVIPGYERRLAHLFDHCVRRGARVVTATEAPIHVSGHAPRSELVRLVELLRPRVVLPVHGQRRHLEAVADLARAAGADTLVVENGQEVAWDGPSLRATGVQRPVGRVLLDDVDADVLDPVLLRHRRTLARDGLVLATVPAGASGVGAPAVQAFGFALAGGVRERLEAGLAAELARAGAGRDSEMLRSTMSRWLKSELRRVTRRRPVVAALVMEL